MYRRPPEVLLLALSLIAASCTHPRKDSEVTARMTTENTAAVMKSCGTKPNLRRSSGGIYSVSLDVPIDEFGQAKIDQIHFRGVIAASVQQDVIAWLSGCSFQPATKNGVRVASIYTVGL